MMKKILSLILCAAMLAGMIVTVSADEPSSWAKEEVEAGILAGLVPEELQKNYQSPVTRGQVAEMFIRLLEKASGRTVETIIADRGAAVDSGAFTDTDDGNVLAANALGIINGTGHGRFSPDGTLKRAQIAAIINRVAKVMGIDTEGCSHDFTDITGNYAWAYDELGWPVNAGIIKGVGGTRFSPGGDLTTEQAILITYRALSALTQNVLKVYVSPEGSSSPDGTRENPYGTLEAARDAVRKMNKTGLTGIDVVLLPGTYSLTETFALSTEDKGSAECRIRYIGEDGATIVGGAALTAADFSKVDFSNVQGDAAYIPESSREKIVMIDLKQFGYMPEDIKQAYEGSYVMNAVKLYLNGEMEKLAQYPNGDGKITIIDGAMLDKDGNVTDNDGNARPNDPDLAVTYITYVDNEVLERVSGWHDLRKAYLYGYVDLLWRVDHTYILGVNAEKGYIEYYYPGTSAPSPQRQFILYNVAEELDAPGEYYIDDDAVLYYYPSEGFESATLSIPVVDNIITVDGADYTTFEHLLIETANRNCVVITADNCTIQDCEVRGTQRTAIKSTGMNNTVSGCVIHNTGDTAVYMDGGDTPTLTHGNNLFYNNLCYDFGIVWGGYCGGLNLRGCGNTASHNEIFGSNHLGIHWGGVENIIEYNYLHDLCQSADDMGAIYGGGFDMIGCEVRYNRFENIGPAEQGNLPDYIYCGCHAVYWDMYNGFNKTYGNVMVGVRGAAVACGNGRSIHIHDNLTVSCKYIVTAICGVYTGAYITDSPEKFKQKRQDYYMTDVWKEAYPVISELVMDMKATTADDPMGWATPVDIVIKNNFCYGDKANCDYRGIRPYSIESPIYTLNPDTIVEPSTKTGDLIIFNSRRTPFPDMEEAFDQAKGFIAISYEDYLQMGRVK